MKNLCPISNLLAIALLFAAALFTNMVTAGPLTPLEESIQKGWQTQPDLRPDMETAYWKYVSNSVNEVKTPLAISNSVVIIDISLNVESKTTIYNIVVSADAVILLPTKAVIARQMCSDPQSSMYLIMMGGRIIYVHFQEGVREHIDLITVTAEDCTGI